MQMIKKYLLLATSLLILSSQMTLALNVSPTVSFERYFGDISENINDSPAPRNYAPGFFKRIVDKNQGQIIKEAGSHPDTKNSIKNLKKSRKLLFLDHKPENDPDTDIDLAIYTLENGNSVGYCLLEQMKMGKGIYSSEPAILAIKSLQVNPNYLQNKLTIPTNSTLTFYESFHPTYVERYAIFELSNGESSLFLDAFYPKDFEVDLESYIVETLNFNMARFARVRS